MGFSFMLYIRRLYFFWLSIHIGIARHERIDNAAKDAFGKYVYECLISYTDAYQYISQYVRDLW